MKKVLNFKSIITLLFTFTLSAVIDSQNTSRVPTKYYDPGVIIGGITWATRNVGEPGTFAARPESSGMFYQWGSNVGWSATDPLVSSNGGRSWVDIDSPGEKWTSANDPCPAGWRIPTGYEMSILIGSGHSWTSNYNNTGVAGRLFGTAPNRIFTPAAGVRNYSNDNTGKLGYSGSDFGVWCNTIEVFLKVENDDTYVSQVSKHTGLNVRCVKLDKQMGMSSTDDKGVTIGGVVWATRNVDKPGTFAARPENPGMFYQWNIRVGWNADELINSNGERTWNEYQSPLMKWETANDPCPAGWRIPTEEELKTLINIDSVWTGDGRLFGNFPNQIFLPAAGHLYSSKFYKLRHQGTGVGTYTASTKPYIKPGDNSLDDKAVCSLTFYNERIYAYFWWPYREAISVRCVKK